MADADKDLGRSAEALETIECDVKEIDVKEIKAAFFSAGISRPPPQAAPKPKADISRPTAASVPATATPRARDAQGRFVASPTASKAATTATPKRTETATPKAAQPKSAPTAKQPAPADKSPFDSPSSTSTIGNAMSRMANAVTAMSAGTAETDPSIKAAQEVAEPMKRGYDAIFGGRNGGERRKEGWWRRVFGELKLFRRESSMFDKEANKRLKGIEDKPTVGAEGGGGMGGGILALLGRFILPIITVAVGALGAFVGGYLIGTILKEKIGKWVQALIDADIPGQISAKWAEFTGWAGRHWDDATASMGRAWEDVTGGMAKWWESASKSMSDTWGNITDTFKSLGSAFAGMLKDKFGIDLPAIGEKAKAVAGRVVETAKTGAQRANEWVKEKTGVDVAGRAKAGAAAVGGAIDRAKAAVPGLVGRAKDAAGGAWDSVKTGAAGALKTGRRRSSFDEAEAARNFTGDTGAITGLSEAQTRALAANTMKTESGGNQRSVNPYGFAGQYQFGAEALSGEGLVNAGKLKVARGSMSTSQWWKGGGHKRFIQDASNWTLPGGLDAFLGDKALQDKAFVTYTNKNIAGGIRSGAISSTDEAGKIAGYAKAAHLKGVGGANRLFLRKQSSTDANGTQTSLYAAQGAAAVRGASLPGPTSKAAVSVPSKAPPSIPAMAPKPPAIAEAPTVRMPIAGQGQRQAPIVVQANPSDSIGQDLSDRDLAHLATGGIARNS